MRKLGRVAESSIGGVVGFKRGFDNGGDNGGRKVSALTAERLRLRNSADHFFGLLHGVVALVSIGSRNRQQNSAKAGPTVLLARREVGAPVKRLAVRSEKSRQRPPALAADSADGGLIAAVDVGPLVAIHLHGDKVFIDDLRDLRIVVGLAIHYVAPMAPDRADVEQYGLVVLARCGKRVFAPFPPLHGLVHGAPQVGGGGFGQVV